MDDPLTEPDPMFTFIGATVLFLALHLGVSTWSRQAFHIDLKLSRGVAALILAAMGFFVLLGRISLWRVAFLAPNDGDVLLLSFILILNGHFIADFLWLAYGAATHGSRPRLDLVVHHLLGMVVSLAGYRLGIGFAMISVGLTSELMPVTTGLQALGQVTRNRRLEDLASRLRLGVLLGWRLPMWILVLGIVLLEMLTRPRPEVEAVYGTAVVTALALIALDLFWSRTCYRSLVSQNAKASAI